MKNPSIIECIDFRPGWEARLSRFLESISDDRDLAYFAPHSYDSETLAKIAARTGRDVYCLFVESERVVGYGLLRGWDEGFVIPSLGVAVHPEVRSKGLGSMILNYLEFIARYRGADTVRLRVKTDNKRAIALYERHGYRWSTDEESNSLLVGVKLLGVGP